MLLLSPRSHDTVKTLPRLSSRRTMVSWCASHLLLVDARVLPIRKLRRAVKTAPQRSAKRRQKQASWRRSAASTASRSSGMYPKVQIALHTTLHAICPAAQARFTPAQCAPRSDAGDAQRPTGVEEALKVLAQRIRRFPEGEYPPLPHPQLLNQLTDELLVAASDGVKSVAAEAPSTRL